jgi:hypothetical protein
MFQFTDKVAVPGHQGLRSEKVGVIDAEYVLHKGIPSLGGPHVNKVSGSFVVHFHFRHSVPVFNNM